MLEVNKIYYMDCLEGMKQLEDNSIDLILTDPPYGYSFMGKSWDKGVPKIEIWKECLRVLKAGAFAFIMSAPRQDVQAQMILNLKQSGFVLSFTPLYWAYASGFPKAGNIGKMVDKRFGKYDNAPSKEIKKDGTSPTGFSPKEGWHQHNMQREYEIKERVTPQAKVLDGSYSGFQPKPAVEIILVAMKPLSEKTYVDQALKNGKGITWLDDCRVPYESEDDKENARFGTQMDIRNNNYKTPQGIYGKNVLSSQQGRFPANLLVSDDILNDGKERSSGIDCIRRKEGTFLEHFYGGKGKEQITYGDSGSFSRYFDLDKWFINKLPDSVKKTFPNVEPIHWTKEQLRLFRDKCGLHNQIVNQKIYGDLKRAKRCMNRLKHLSKS